MPDVRVSRLREIWRAISGGSWPRALLRLAILAGVIAAGAVLYAASGWVPLAASSGHARITYWYLDFAKRRGVAVQSPDLELSGLDDPALVLKGAGHYATGCAPCHGAPGKPPSVIAMKMTPQPPFLPSDVPRWNNDELFWIVRHGIKYTGMPAWPALARTDEIRAMVAFLRALPAMKPETYEWLAYGGDARREIPARNTAAPDTLHSLVAPFESALANCARCHGTDGMGRAGVFPRLANQNRDYLLASLQAFANGARHSGFMQPAAASLDETTRRALAEHYAAGDARAPFPVEDIASVKRGRGIATHGVPERGIPSCAACHGPEIGQKNPLYPELAGQYEDYLVLQLTLFQAGTRGGTPYAHIMELVTKRMTPGEMRDVARYYASQPDGDRDENGR